MTFKNYIAILLVFKSLELIGSQEDKLAEYQNVFATLKKHLSDIKIEKVALDSGLHMKYRFLTVKAEQAFENYQSSVKELRRQINVKSCVGGIIAGSLLSCSFPLLSKIKYLQKMYLNILLASMLINYNHGKMYEDTYRFGKTLEEEPLQINPSSFIITYASGLISSLATSIAITYFL